MGHTPHVATASTAERSRARLRALSTAGLALDEFASAATSILREAVPFDAACTLSLDPSTLLVTDTVKVELPPDRDADWAMHEYEREDVAQFVDLALRADPVTTVDRETGGDALRSERMAELHLPNCGLGHEMRAVAKLDGAAWGGLCLFREQGLRGFGAAEVEYIATAAPTIALGVRASLVAGAAAGIGASHGPAVLIVGARDEVEQLSPDAEQHLAQLDPTGGFGKGALPLSLLTLVSAARSFGAGSYPRPPRVRLRSSDGRWLVAHAAPLASRDGASAGEVVVTIEEARPPEIVPLVVAALGLTPREGEVTRLVLRGVDTATIAHRLAMSAYTVQDHLKSIFAKAGVRNRKELVGRVFLDQYASRIGTPVGPAGWFTATDPAADGRPGA